MLFLRLRVIASSFEVSKALILLCVIPLLHDLLRVDVLLLYEIHDLLT